MLAPVWFLILTPDVPTGPSHQLPTVNIARTRWQLQVAQAGRHSALLDVINSRTGAVEAVVIWPHLTPNWLLSEKVAPRRVGRPTGPA